MSVTRREFLQGAAVLGSAAMFPLDSAAAPGKSILILGAGISGLSGAHELYKAGHSITVIEARPHAGGRLYTARYPFADQLYGEAGGEFIESAHKHVLYFVKHLGLQVRDAYGPESCWINGKIRSEDEIPTVRKVFEKIRSELRHINSFESPASSPARELDQISFLVFLQRLDLDEAGIAYMRNVVGDLMVTDIEQISALHMAYEFMLPLDREEFGGRIVGGNDQLATKLASEFRRFIHYGCPAKKIHWDSKGVSVITDSDQHFEGDELIITVPASCLKNIVFEPELPAETAQAIESLAYGRVMKTLIQYSNRFWNRSGSGTEFLDSLEGIGNLYHSSQHQKGPRGLLTCYSGGKRADALAAETPEVRVQKILQGIQTFWPDASKHYEGHFHKFWVEEKFSRGGYAYFAPGQMLSIRQLLRQSLDRIHFAGEHTADWQGYINGAIESGIRAAAEIDPEIGRRWAKIVPRESSHISMSIPALQPSTLSSVT